MKSKFWLKRVETGREIERREKVLKKKRERERELTNSYTNINCYENFLPRLNFRTAKIKLPNLDFFLLCENE